MPEKLSVDQVNELDREAFVKRFGALYEHSPWVAERAWKRRPFEGFEALHKAFEDELYAAPRDMWLDIIRAHPDLAGEDALAGKLTEESAREQSSAGLDRLSPKEFEALAKVNREYREKFGIPFVVYVREHTRESILQNAKRRLGNTREQEIQTALGEISKIARYRLQEIVEWEGDHKNDRN